LKNTRELLATFSAIAEPDPSVIEAKATILESRVIDN
jgi:hypothetical protein